LETDTSSNKERRKESHLKSTPYFTAGATESRAPRPPSHHQITWQGTVCSGWLPGDGPDGVDDAGEVAEEGEDEADPELNLQPYQPTQ